MNPGYEKSLREFSVWADEFFARKENLNRPVTWPYITESWRRYRIDALAQGGTGAVQYLFKDWVKEKEKEGVYILNPHLYDPVTRLPLFYDDSGYAVRECTLHCGALSRELMTYVIIGTNDYWFNRGTGL